jgi:hypothetical protein
MFRVLAAVIRRRNNFGFNRYERGYGRKRRNKYERIEPIVFWYFIFGIVFFY